jgi:hypothetical protein
MSHVRRKLFKGKLTDLLARADDEAIFVMVWATFAIQSGRPESARPLLVFPPEAATRDLASKFAVHPWKLETMLNEVLTTPKLKLLPNHPNRRLDCRKFEAIARVTNALASLENAEDGLTLERINVLREIPRIGQRQFEWQRGFFSYPQFYRAGFVYGGDLTRAFFAEANGFTMHDFALACFALRALFLDKPIVSRGGGRDEIGISEISSTRSSTWSPFRILGLGGGPRNFAPAPVTLLTSAACSASTPASLSGTPASACMRRSPTFSP